MSECRARLLCMPTRRFINFALTPLRELDSERNLYT